jgi:beta-1,4-mannosyl-glycoprotein beta-1,4-N-acetylglucosaminyltransferase
MVSAVSHKKKISLGGWHFSWVLPAEAWRLKFLAAAHQENATQANEALEDQMRMVSAGRDLLVADRRYLRLELSDSLLPPALRARPEAYEHLLLPSEANTGTQS